MVLMMAATENSDHSAQAADKTAGPLVYVGTYTKGDSQGIYVLSDESPKPGGSHG